MSIVDFAILTGLESRERRSFTVCYGVRPSHVGSCTSRESEATHPGTCEGYSPHLHASNSTHPGTCEGYSPHLHASNQAE
jgi:hypothetical protein